LYIRINAVKGEPAALPRDMGKCRGLRFMSTKDKQKTVSASRHDKLFLDRPAAVKEQAVMPDRE